jgi:hypothetical protein
MRPCPRWAWAGALAMLALSTAPASAAWNNVFQVCCTGCRSNVTQSQYVAPVAAQPCQQPCQTVYEKRYYYQAVTTYRTSTYLEPVTSYRTSYYYEPVTTVRYSTYYDPCTGCPQQVATQQTSLQLRSQTCPVTSYLQRTCVQPVTTQQQMFYYVPKTTCCTTTEGAPIYGGPVTGAPLPAVPPGVSDTGGQPPPGVSDSGSSQQGSGINPQQFNPNPGGSGASSPRLGGPQPAQPAQSPPRTPPADLRLDKVVSLKPVEGLEGRVIGGDNATQAGVRVLFINAANSRERQSATTDATGRFQVSLNAGRWLVYVQGSDGQDDFRQEIQIGSPRSSPLTLVKR